MNTRTFPQLSDIVNNSQTIGEILPTTTRYLNFTFTVRDQQGGVADDDVRLTVIKTSTPFKVISHTAPAVLDAGSAVDILWDTGDTQMSPINCTQVDILLSIDGGYTFTSYLAQKTNNDGSAIVIIPVNTASNTTTRFKVACSNNIFFAISDTNLTIINTESELNCSSSDLTIGDTQYIRNTIEQSQLSILADGLIVVEENVNVSYQAPSITLKPGFHAVSGSIFTATAMSISCDLLQTADIAKRSRSISAAAEELTDIQLNSTNPISQWLTLSELPIGLTQILNDNSADAKEFHSDSANKVIIFSTDSDLLASDTNRLSDVYLYDNEVETLSLVSITADNSSGNGASTQGRINGSGQYIVYRSEADDLLSQTVDTNNVADIFLYHIPGAAQTRISYQTDGSQTREPSANLAIAGEKPYLVYDKADKHQQLHIYAADTLSQNSAGIKLSKDYNNFGELIDNSQPGISADGRYVAYLGHSKDENKTCTQHILDRTTGISQVTLCPDEITEAPELWYPFFDAKAENIYWQKIE